MRQLGICSKMRRRVSRSFCNKVKSDENYPVNKNDRNSKMKIARGLVGEF